MTPIQPGPKPVPQACPVVAVGATFTAEPLSLPIAFWMRRLGLEWAFRLLSEPRRLWRRYLFGNTRFLMLMLREARGSR